MLSFSGLWLKPPVMSRFSADGLELADATKAPHALMTMIVAGTPPLSDEEKVVALAPLRKPAGCARRSGNSRATKVDFGLPAHPT